MIDGLIPPQLRLLTDLELSFNSLQGILSTQLLNGNLEVLDLGNNQLTGVPVEFSNETNYPLRSLILSNNQIVGTVPASIAHLSNLTTMRLDDNSMDGTIPAQLFMTPLRELWLHNNQFSGEISNQIGAALELTDLRLFANQLNSTLPESLYQLTNLVHLDAGDQGFTGTLSPLIGDIMNLEYLSLRNNKLTGTIPDVLGNISTLGKPPAKISKSHLPQILTSLVPLYSHDCIGGKYVQRDRFNQLLWYTGSDELFSY